MQTRIKSVGNNLRSASFRPTTRRALFQAMPPEELLTLRASIDNIDAALIHLLAERFKCTQQVGRLKARLGLPASRSRA